jgi:hypothetical protein
MRQNTQILLYVLSLHHTYKSSQQGRRGERSDQLEMSGTVMLQIVQKLTLEGHRHYFALKQRATTHNINLLFLSYIKYPHLFNRIAIEVFLPLKQYLWSTQTELHISIVTGTIKNLNP